MNQDRIEVLEDRIDNLELLMSSKSGISDDQYADMMEELRLLWDELDSLYRDAPRRKLAYEARRGARPKGGVR